MAATLFAQTLSSVLSTAAIACACVGGGLLYFRYVRMPRPPLGVFDSSDLAPLLISLFLLPVFYLVLPPLILTILLALTFLGTLQTGLSPLLPRLLVWGTALTLLAAIVGTSQLEHTGWAPAAALHLVANDALLIFTVIVAANINTQYGMRFVHVAWYSLLLGAYDAFFIWVIPLTPLLSMRLAGLAFNLSFGMTLDGYQNYLGIGDMLMFTLVTCTAYKGFGRHGAISAIVIVALFGVLAPTVGVPALLTLLHMQARFIPVQFTFGPAVFVTWLRLSRGAPENTMRQWEKSYSH